MKRNWKHKRYHKKGIEPPCIVEAHHVIPRSLGGVDNDSNIVVVTPREHFILHKILTKINPCKKTFAALGCMRMSNSKRTRLNSRQINEARLAVSIARSGPLSVESLAKHHAIHLGAKRSDETKRRISESHLGRPSPFKGILKTEEDRAKMRGIPKRIKTIECPHCGKLGASHNMKRYHFDNCKLVPPEE